MVLRGIGLLVALAGLFLAAVNLLYLPFVADYHHGEWPVLVFHVAVVLVGVGLIALGRWLWRR
jgi:hypothetical protein